MCHEEKIIKKQEDEINDITDAGYVETNFISYEEVRKQNCERMKQLSEFNYNLRGKQRYKPSLQEEMNLNLSPDYIYLGKGPLQWRSEDELFR